MSESDIRLGGRNAVLMSEPCSAFSIINGFDKDGRPIIYMRPGRENTETGDRQLRHLVWCL